MTTTVEHDVAQTIAARPPRPPRGGRRRARMSRHLLVFLVPAVVLAAALLVYPVVLSVVTSFQSQDGAFVGFANYARFFSDPHAGQEIFNTFLRGVFGVIPSYIIGLLAALLINQLVRGRTTMTVIAVLPFVISAPVALNIWRSLLDTRTGIPGALGWDIPNVLVDPQLVWPVLFLINAWGSFQFYLLLLVAARRRIPEELYEAASIDGANVWQRFTAVTMPGLAAASLAACGIHFIASFQEFNLIYILTGGGPVGVTTTLPIAAYQSAFSYYQPTYATTLTTISMVLMLVTIGVAAALLAIGRRVRAASERRSTLRWARAAAGPPAASATAPPTARRPRRKPRTRSRGRRRSGLALGAIVLGAFALTPILFQVSLSLDGTPAGSQPVSLIPRDPSLQNYVAVLGNPDLWSNDNIALPPLALNVVNSLIVTAACTVLVTLIGMIAGYALARMRSRIIAMLLSFFVLLQLVPVIVLVFPLYDILSGIGLLGTQFGLILATSALYVPMSVLFFQVFFRSMGLESEEAAAIDGAGPIRTFVSIVMPVSKSVIGAVATYTLINTWNEFLLASTLISDSRARTLPPALNQYMASPAFLSSSSPGEQAVYLLIPVAVAAVILIATQRLLLSAYESGGVKG